MKQYLVDTDILIDFLRSKEKAQELLVDLLESGGLCCSAITVAEIYAGMRSHEKEKTDELLDSLDILDVTREVAEKAGVYKKTIKSQSLELADCLIAATAFISQATLVTGNIKHYPMADIEKVTLLS